MTSRDVVLCLRDAGLDIAETVTSKRDLAKCKPQFNAWAKETGLPYVQDLAHLRHVDRRELHGRNAGEADGRRRGVSRRSRHRMKKRKPRRAAGSGGGCSALGYSSVKPRAAGGLAARPSLPRAKGERTPDDWSAGPRSLAASMRFQVTGSCPGCNAQLRIRLGNLVRHARRRHQAGCSRSGQRTLRCSPAR